MTEQPGATVSENKFWKRFKDAQTVIALATVVNVAVAAFQWLALKEANHQTLVAQTAWVTADTEDIPRLESGDVDTVIMLKLKNLGNTPALNVKIYGRLWKVEDRSSEAVRNTKLKELIDNDPKDPDFASEHFAGWLAPSGEYEYTALSNLNLSDSRIALLKSFDVKEGIYFHYQIAYDDIAGNHKITEAVLQLIPLNNAWILTPIPLNSKMT